MATINFYLDKEDKKGFAPIHLRINCQGSQIKISTGQKVLPKLFNKKDQRVADSAENSKELNHYLDFLKSRADELLHHSNKKTIKEKEIKTILNDHIKAYKENHQINIIKESALNNGVSFTFVDLFAGAGGFSEGFLQAEVGNKYFDFLAASDINENCELTHAVRYNHQLGLDASFLCQDITEPDFLDNLLNEIGDKKVDVVCGGPPCQSFSLAGKRKKYDKKDDLFSHYLEVIKALQPKYFIMENVKGILTKERGKIRDIILKEINSIIDINDIPILISFVMSLKSTNKQDDFFIECLVKRIEIEQQNELEKEESKESYIRFVESRFRKLTPKIVDYKTSKTDININTIRHGFNLLIRNKEWEKLKRDIIKEKDFCNIDNDSFVNTFNHFLGELDTEKIIGGIEVAFKQLSIPAEFEKECDNIISALNIYINSFDETVNDIKQFCNDEKAKELEMIVDSLRLYKIEKPFIAKASNYGVPQNRERVLFIGCRKDQKYISDIPATVSEDQKVTVFEALFDLDFVGNDEEAHHYMTVDHSKHYNGEDKNLKKLIKKRRINGEIEQKIGKTYSDWSKKGRLIKRYHQVNKPFYVRNSEALQKGEIYYDVLNNHKTSKQNDTVIRRLNVILEVGDYKKAQAKLNKLGLSSSKRNYNVLKPAEQSPTVLTMPDDYIHYNTPRALTVREMARLQSFDDSFVFQGKRSTGGNNRKSEVPQYTLVGNAVPPLLARAIAMHILENIS